MEETIEKKNTVVSVSTEVQGEVLKVARERRGGRAGQALEKCRFVQEQKPLVIFPCRAFAIGEPNELHAEVWRRHNQHHQKRGEYSDTSLISAELFQVFNSPDKAFVKIDRMPSAGEKEIIKKILEELKNQLKRDIIILGPNFEPLNLEN